MLLPKGGVTLGDQQLAHYPHCYALEHCPKHSKQCIDTTSGKKFDWLCFWWRAYCFKLLKSTQQRLYNVTEKSSGALNTGRTQLCYRMLPSVQEELWEGERLQKKRSTLPPGLRLCSVWWLNSLWKTVYSCHLLQNVLLRTSKVKEIVI